MITPRTKAIVPVHVYGNACDVDGFDRLAGKYGVKIIYDAAHAFGTALHLHGDMSMFSFHPTKLFHSGEGGCLVFKDAELQPRLFNLRNFAIEDEVTCRDVGTNAKMNELQALMGILNLERMEELLAWRRRIAQVYRDAFAGTAAYFVGRSLNAAYCPVLFENESVREKVYHALKSGNVFTRRYFYPLLSDLAPYVYARGTCRVAEDAAKRILCLPTYYGLSEDEARGIADNVLEIVS